MLGELKCPLRKIVLGRQSLGKFLLTPPTLGSFSYPMLLAHFHPHWFLFATGASQLPCDCWVLGLPLLGLLDIPCARAGVGAKSRSLLHKEWGRRGCGISLLVSESLPSYLRSPEILREVAYPLPAVSSLCSAWWASPQMCVTWPQLIPQ